MSKSSRFRTPFGSQLVNRSSSLLKSARHQFCTIVSLIWDKLSCNEVLLFGFEILGRFLNTTTTADKISCSNTDNLAQQIQRQLSQEPKRFPDNFFVFLKPPSNLGYLKESDESHSLIISEINDSERGGYLNI